MEMEGLHASHCYPPDPVAGCRRGAGGATRAGLLDEYLEFLAGRCRPNMMLAVVDLATATRARGNVAPTVLSFLQRAVDAVQAGSDAMAIFGEDELQAMAPLAGMFRDDPEWMRGILAVAQ